MTYASMIHGASHIRLDDFRWRSLVESYFFTFDIVFVACHMGLVFVFYVVFLNFQ